MLSFSLSLLLFLSRPNLQLDSCLCKINPKLFLAPHPPTSLPAPQNTESLPCFPRLVVSGRGPAHLPSSFLSEHHAAVCTLTADYKSSPTAPNRLSSMDLSILAVWVPNGSCVCVLINIFFSCFRSLTRNLKLQAVSA